MTQEEAINALEQEWERPNGFFANIRVGKFDPDEGERIVRLVSSIDLPPNVPVERRLVSLLWYLPSFTDWQRQRVSEAGGDTPRYVRFVNGLANALETLLGVP